MSKRTSRKNSSQSKNKAQSSPSSSNDREESETDESYSNTAEQENDVGEIETEVRHRDRTQLDRSSNDLTDDEENNGNLEAKNVTKSIKIKHRQGSISSQSSPSSKIVTQQKTNSMKYALCIIVGLGLAYLWWPKGSVSPPDDKDWRSKIDPKDILPHDQRNTLRASLKSILEKSGRNEGVSTLLLLSSDEETAAKLGQCVLDLVNTKKRKNQISTEINFQSHHGGKVQLDSNLRSLLESDDGIRAVLLRHIDDNSSGDIFERARLLFAYCDGENPVVPHRLIIMTATSKSENHLREMFKTLWPREHDFVDALMSRISGHTLRIENGQASIC